MFPGTDFANEWAAHQQYSLTAGSHLWAMEPWEPLLQEKRPFNTLIVLFNPLILLKIHLLEAYFPWMPPATGAGGSSSYCGTALRANREAVPRPVEVPQSHLLLPRQGKTQPSRTSCCTPPRFPKAKFPSSSPMKCPRSDESQPSAWAPWEANQSRGLWSPQWIFSSCTGLSLFAVLKGQGS